MDEPPLRSVQPFGISHNQPRRPLLGGCRPRCRSSARPGCRRTSAATATGPALSRPQLPAEALLLDLAPQLGGVAAALMPAPVKVLGVTIHRAAARLLAPGRQLSRPQPTLHGLAVDAHGTRDAPRRPALAMQRYSLVEPATSDGVPVRRGELSCRCRGHIGRRLRILHFLHSRGRCRAQITVVPVEHSGHRVAKVAQKVPPVRNLDGLGCAGANAVGVSTRAVSRDDLDAGMTVQPRSDRLRVAIGQHVDRTVALEIDDERAVALSSAPSPVVDADDVGRRHRGQGCRSDQAQQRVAADRHGQARRQAGAGFASCAESDGALRLGEAGGASHPRQGCGRQALGKDAPRALGSRAPETPDLHVELADTTLPRQVAEAAEVSAVDTVRRTPAQGT